MPKDPDDVDYIYSLVSLSSDRFILLYGTLLIPGGYTYTVRISIASIDFTNEKYELVGNYYEILPMFANCDPIFVFKSTLIVKCGRHDSGRKIYLFNVDTKLSTFKLLKSIDESSYISYFNIIDGTIVFAKMESPGLNVSQIVYDFMMRFVK
jgi:hypothetical protein